MFDEPEIITQYPLNIGLLIVAGGNYEQYLHDKKIRRALLPWLLEQSKYQESTSWNDLSKLLKEQLPNHFTMAIIRAGMLNYYFPEPFHDVLFNSFQDVKRVLSSLINDNIVESAPLLPYLKLSLLAMKRTLDDEQKRTILKKEFRKHLRLKI